MTYRQDNPAAIPQRPERASRGRLLAKTASGPVGEWSWQRTALGSSQQGELVQVKNTGSDTIKRFEACVYADSEDSTEFFSKVYECGERVDIGNCRSGQCDYGTCATWPVTYSDVYDRALLLNTFQFNVTSTASVPKPGNLCDWLVASEDIAAGAVGYAYATGIHYAFVWDKNDLLNHGPELRFVDLPEYDAGYDTDDSSPTINLPLQVRANGRARVLAYDRNEYVSDGTISDDPQWPMTKVRLALIQRTSFFTYPTLPCSLTGATETATGSNKYEYDWTLKHDASATSAKVAKAINLAEEGNTATQVNGLSVADLNACFGVGDWEMQNANASNMDVMMTFSMDADGAVVPYFCLPNQIVPT